MTTPTHSPKQCSVSAVCPLCASEREFRTKSDAHKWSAGFAKLAHLREQNRRLHESLSELIDHIDHYGGVSKGAVLMCGRARAVLAGKGEQL